MYIYIQPYIHVIYFVGTHMYYMLFGWVSHLPVRPCDAHLDWIPSNGANPLTQRFFWVLGGSSNLVLKWTAVTNPKTITTKITPYKRGPAMIP